MLEHALSDRLLDAIDVQLGRPTRDPHGDFIPAADGIIQRPDAVVLREVSDGLAATIVRISDRDPALLRHLQAESIAIGTHLTVVRRAPFASAMSLRVGDPGRAVDLGDEAASQIWVTVLRER